MRPSKNNSRVGNSYEGVQKHHERHGAISCSQVHNIDDNAAETIANNCHDLQVKTSPGKLYIGARVLISVTVNH
nr:hypothetical protein [Tanacetum cinerariifolium]